MNSGIREDNNDTSSIKLHDELIISKSKHNNDNSSIDDDDDVNINSGLTQVVVC